ncbi:sodium-extruding oxaloacetate decarboxylase subunit alpha [Sedimenticola selenatireducens]|uniref:Oxaloacetate decarboxylase subunit alpha n=1 Tax=Sedimenticola selenatireducens TaxID=191960 RepID=A0A2N6CZU9_9GAMM|nr:sodium-extruding oxaloacetate decarboxylase subunit alpha [Sedimenticola selenatireducens]PLX62944.1 MAG: oxaloacetate decarboxylase subunit alpha [Sedimenticola selenatireducens]
MTNNTKLGITEVVLRDAHQSLFATRLRIEDMLPIAAKLDQVGFWSLETWGGATFDSCIHFLGEDPWERLRLLKQAMPNTPQQMLFRAQNILGYRHYADDVVERFVERAAANGMDIFRIFDAMNDLRNLETAVKATLKAGKHAQGTISYTVSPVHDTAYWLDMAKGLEDMGANSICIKDMAGLLKPYVAFDLISQISEAVSVPIALHCHATTGLSTATIVKAAEAGVDMVDTSISSMSMTYGHSPTESVVSILNDTARDSGLDIHLLEEIAAYFREVRKKYAKFEGSLKGVDSRILVAQVPGGMLTNMEGQLKEQGAADRLDEVLEEIPRVRKDLGYIPLVTPTSQIVGTQSVLNVLNGERYKNITKETAGVLKGEYGATPAPVDSALQSKVLEGAEPIRCRPADLLEPEMDKLTREFQAIAEEKGITVAENLVDDVLIYALFPQIGLKFLENRNNPDAFEPAPQTVQQQPVATPAPPAPVAQGAESYTVTVNGKSYSVTVAAGGEIQQVIQHQSSAPAPGTTGEAVPAPLAGNIFKVKVAVGQHINAGDVIMIREAMKMETEVRATRGGIVERVVAKEGEAVQVGDPLVILS